MVRRRAAGPRRAHRGRHHGPRRRVGTRWVGWRRTSATGGCPLEMCPTSNIHTGAVASIAEHPIDLLRRLRFRVTVNTDNRLMSGVTLSSGIRRPRRSFGSVSARWNG